MTRVISIVSGKGGVGKTTLSINLAYALAKNFKKRTLLIDGNITTSHIGLSLGVTKANVMLNDMLRNENVSFEPYTYIENFDLLLSAISPRSLENVEMSRLSSLIEKLSLLGYDFILLDTAPGLGKEAVEAIKASKEVLFITNPLTPSAIDIIRVSELCSELMITSLGLVLNMVRRKPYELSAFEIERFVNVPVIGEIPFDKSVLIALASKKTFVELFPKSKVSKAINKICSTITGEVFLEEKKGFLERIKSIFIR
ncbi:MAG: P-loop NTPase [Candidatus Aenigmatarchaeota archaeon]